MKKVGLIKYSEEWEILYEKKSFIYHIISTSLHLEMMQLNEVITNENNANMAQGIYLDGPIQGYIKNTYDILLDYNNNAVNHNVDSTLLFQEKRDATIDYILENDCRYEEFVENWGELYTFSY